MKLRFSLMCRFAVVGLFLIGSLACRPAVSADGDAENSPTDEPAVENAANNPSDDSKLAEEENQAVEEEKDPYAVPDGDAKELLAYIQSIKQLEPPRGGDRKEFTQFIEKAVGACVGAADKILAGDATDEEHVAAIQEKLQMLGIGERFRIDGAAKQRTAFIESLKKDKRPAIAGLIQQFVLKERAGEWPKLKKDEKKAFLDELVAYLGDAEISGEHLGLVHEIGQTMENTGDPESAAELYLAMIPIFQKSDNERIVAYAGKLEGIARRLRLVGNEMELEGSLLDQSPFDWSAYKGKVVLIDFWATWCGPCRQEMPNVRKAYTRYHEKGFDVVGISLDNNREKVEAYVESNEIPWVTLFSDDEEATGWEHPMASYYGISGIPTTILVGQDGKVVSLSARGPGLGEQLQELLGDPLPIEDEGEDDGDDGDKEEG